MWGSSAVHGFDATEKCEHVRAIVAQNVRDADTKINKAPEEQVIKKQEATSPSQSAEILKKAASCQKKGGVWINDRCEIILETAPSNEPVPPSHNNANDKGKTVIELDPNTKDGCEAAGNHWNWVDDKCEIRTK